MEVPYIPLIMERLDKIVTEDRARKYPTAMVVKIIVILKIYGVSYRSPKYFFNNHREFMELLDITDWHYINSAIIDIINPENDNAFIDTDSLSIQEWKITTASVYDKNMAFEMIDLVRDYNYILMDAAYDSSDIYDYIFENTYAVPVIDTNKRRGIINDRLTVNRKCGIELRKRESSRYKLRWDIERTFSILKEILGMEYVWYVKQRNYDAAIGEIIVAYNCIIMANKITGRAGRRIMHIVS